MFRSNDKGVRPSLPLLLICCLLPAAQLHARVFIINTQETVNPEDFAPPRNNVSAPQGNNIDARTMLLHNYRYPEIQATVSNRQQTLGQLLALTQEWGQTGTSSRNIEEVRAYTVQADKEIKSSLVSLSRFALKEIKQLYEIETRNAKQLDLLKRRLDIVKVEEGATVKSQFTPADTAESDRSTPTPPPNPTKKFEKTGRPQTR